MEDALPHSLLREQLCRMNNGLRQIENDRLEPRMAAAEQDGIVAMGTPNVEHMSCSPGHRSAPCYLKSREAGKRAHGPLVKPPFIVRQFLMNVCRRSGTQEVFKSFLPCPVEEVEQHIVVKRLGTALEKPFPGDWSQ